jgi:endonuclease/exonuclease/phosphatase (EEP) superfamily protein YafD
MLKIITAEHLIGTRLSGWLASRALLLAWTMAAAACLGALAPWHHHAGRLHESLPWVLGLLSHWQWFYLVAGLFGAGLALVFRRYTSIAAAAALLFSWSFYMPAAPLHEETLTAGDDMQVATVNLNFDNTDTRKLFEWLVSGDAPHLVAIQEFTSAHQSSLLGPDGAGVRAAYPHRLLLPQDDQFGLAVLSKLPLAQAETVLPADEFHTPKFRGRGVWRGSEIALTVVHPMPPISAEYAQVRDESLLEESRNTLSSGLPGIILGDMNDTPWSASLRSMQDNFRRVNSLAPTWPNVSGGFSLLPLDHILVTRHWQRVGSFVGPDVGSDHRPSVAKLALPR